MWPIRWAAALLVAGCVSTPSTEPASPEEFVIVVEIVGEPASHSSLTLAAKPWEQFMGNTTPPTWGNELSLYGGYRVEMQRVVPGRFAVGPFNTSSGADVAIFQARQRQFSTLCDVDVPGSAARDGIARLRIDLDQDGLATLEGHGVLEQGWAHRSFDQTTDAR
ncbi:MAG: hypothetical protein AAFZ65_18415 [Planctomycetota bacterium]